MYKFIIKYFEKDYRKSDEYFLLESCSFSKQISNTHAIIIVRYISHDLAFYSRFARSSANIFYRCSERMSFGSFFPVIVYIHELWRPLFCYSLPVFWKFNFCGCSGGRPKCIKLESKIRHEKWCSWNAH